MQETSLHNEVPMRHAQDTASLTCRQNQHFKWWLDVSHVVHTDCKEQTGSTQSIVQGSTISTPTKHKINTRSSANTELVASDNIIPHEMWMSSFLDYQGYKAKETIMY